MDTISQFLASLANYFGATAQVSGGLVGLMFVALTFNIRTLGLRGDPALRALAQQTLSDFLLVLVLSLAMLVPNMPADNLGVLLAILGAVGIARAGRSLLLVHRAEARTRPGLFVRQFWLSIAGNVSTFACGALVLAHSFSGSAMQPADLSTAGSLLVSAPIMLLLSGCRTAWLLVLHGAD